MSNKLLVDQLINTLNEAHQKNQKFAEALATLGAETDASILDDVIIEIEKSLVLAMGGTQEHWEYLDSSFQSVFFEFGNSNVDKEELKAQIKHVIDKDFKGEVEINIIGSI